LIWDQNQIKYAAIENAYRMAMLKVAIAFVAIVALARADIEQEVANERGEIEYRLSFKTKDVEPAGSDFSDAEQAQREQFTSTGKFSVEIIGKDGTTGPQDLIDHPSMVKNDDGTWKKEPGMVQVAKINAADVGEIKEVKITGDSEDKWSPQWIKVNSNDFHTGHGNGIFYATIDSGIKKDEPFEASTEFDESGEDGHFLHKCMAQFCMKAEHKYLMEGDDEPPEDDHGGHFGPLGEGMPGTEHDPSLTRGHFMREFLAMQHVDEDDEDFLRTHSV